MLRRFVPLGLAVIPVIAACRGSEQADDPALAEPGDPATLSIQGRELETRMVQVDSSFFSSHRELPYLGRAILAADFAPGATSVVVISHPLWEELGARPDLIGQHMSLAGREVVLVGVMPPGFPRRGGSIAWTQKRAP